MFYPGRARRSISPSTEGRDAGNPDPGPMSEKSTHLLFAACAPGLEALLLSELLGFGRSVNPQVGGVELRGPLSTLYRVCLKSRIAESVRLRLKPFSARNFVDLKKELAKLPFRAFLAPGAQVSLHVTTEKSKLWHSQAVEERVKEVLSERAQLEVTSPAAGVQRIHVRVKDDEVQISLDAAGERMHRRGYRPYVGPASLRETLAFALFSTALERLGDSLAAPVLWDPFCGAGTIGLEALHFASGGLPGEARHHAFSAWRCFSQEDYDAARELCVREEGQSARLRSLRVIASDRDEKVLDLCAQNVSEAGFSASVQRIAGDVGEVAQKVPEGAFVVTNPPYGKRLESSRALSTLLTVLRRRPDLTPALVLVGGDARKRLPVSAPALFRTKNGGLSVSARLLSLPAK